jgi:hypothetical protein
MKLSNPDRRLADISLYDRSIAFLVICFLYSCYLLTYTGVMQSSDGLSMFATVESMVRRGEVDTNQLLWMGLQQGSFGPDGDLYSRKGPGMTLLALPLVWLGQQWSALGLVQMALLLNPLLTAWTGGLLYRAIIRLGWSRFVAVVTALAFGLATLAWPYTQTFFSDPVAMWGLFSAFYGILAFSQSRRKRYLFLGGLAWGLAYLARSINLITLPVYVFALAAVIGDWRLEIRDWRLSRSPIPDPRSPLQNPQRQQEDAIPTQHPTDPDHAVVGEHQSTAQLDGHCHQPIKGVERVKVEANTAGGVEQIGKEGMLHPFDQGDLHPPEIPIVLPAVEAITGDGAGEMGSQRPGHYPGEQRVEQNHQGMDPTSAERANCHGKWQP